MRAASCVVTSTTTAFPSMLWRRRTDGATGTEAGAAPAARPEGAGDRLRRVLRTPRPLRRARARGEGRRRRDPGIASPPRRLPGLPRRTREPARARRRRAGALAAELG